MKTLLLVVVVLTPAGHAEARAKQEGLEGHWEGAATARQKDWALALDVRRNEGTLEARVDATDFGLYAVPVASITTMRDSVSLIISAFGGDTVFLRGRRTGDTITGSYTEGALSGVIELRRTGRAPRWAREEAVRFTSGDATLVDTLVLPDGRGPHPAFVITHGSGPQTREVLRYRGQAHFFARQGVATLIYDRRGRGASSGDPDTFDFFQFADDAIAGVHALQRRDDIIRNRVGVGGFSQGGWVAPIAAMRSQDVAFVLVGSTPGITGDEQNATTVRSMLSARGRSASHVDSVLRVWTQVTAFQNGATVDTASLRVELARFQQDTLFRFMQLPTGELRRRSARTHATMTLDPATVWPHVKVPVLSLWGADDAFVPAERSRQVIENVLRTAGRTSR